MKLTKSYFEIRRKELDDIFNNIKGDLQELSDYFCPRGTKFLIDDVDKPIKKSKKILDSCPLIAVRNFSSGMATGATNPAHRWFKIKIRNYKLKKTLCGKKMVCRG